MLFILAIHKEKSEKPEKHEKKAPSKGNDEYYRFCTILNFYHLYSLEDCGDENLKFKTLLVPTILSLSALTFA